MSTDESNEQEAPGVRTAKADEEDTEGHVRTAMGGDPDFGSQSPSVHTSLHTAAKDDDDDTEGHVKAGGH
jgi:hypothetical protein